MSLGGVQWRQGGGSVGGGGRASLFRERRIVRDLGRSFIGLGPEVVIGGPVVFAMRITALVVLIIALCSTARASRNSFMCGL